MTCQQVCFLAVAANPPSFIYNKTYHEITLGMKEVSVN